MTSEVVESSVALPKDFDAAAVEKIKRQQQKDEMKVQFEGIMKKLDAKAAEKEAALEAEEATTRVLTTRRGVERTLRVSPGRHGKSSKSP